MQCEHTLRCVRMCAINLALRNLYGYVIQGNSLADERRLVYRTGFDLSGFISEVPLGDCPEPVQMIVAKQTPPIDSFLESASLHEPRLDTDIATEEQLSQPKSQLRLF